MLGSLSFSRVFINIKQAFKNIQHHFLRSFLTLLGVLVGTAAVVALLTGSELATESALSQFKKLGVDLIAVSFSQSSGEEDHSQGDFNQAAIDQFKSKNIILAAPYTMHFSQITYQNVQSDSNVLGLTGEMSDVLKLSLSAGRFITNLDKNAFYCVVGHDIAKTLQYDQHNLVGEQIKINNYYFTIIGVLEPADKSLFLLTDTNESILIPLSTSLQLYKNAQISHVIFKTVPEKPINDIQAEVQSYFEKTRPGMQLNFRSPESIIENMQKQNHIFKMLLGFIGSVALIVGGIGVMNIMLVSVTERKREIGIRMAVGANHHDILYLFLAEAAILTLLGGVAGIVIGEAIGFITAKISHWPFHFLPMPIFIGFIVSALVGLFFGFYPAQKASRLDPIEILRTA